MLERNLLYEYVKTDLYERQLKMGMLSPYAEPFYITTENLSRKIDTIEKINKETEKTESKKQDNNIKINNTPKKQDIKPMPDKAQNGSELTDQKNEGQTKVGKKVHRNISNKKQEAEKKERNFIQHKEVKINDKVKEPTSTMAYQNYYNILPRENDEEEEIENKLIIDKKVSERLQALEAIIKQQ